MRKAEVYQQEMLAGILEETKQNHYRFTYAPGYRDHRRKRDSDGGDSHKDDLFHIPVLF